MPVRTQENVSLPDIFLFLGTHGIAHNPWIKENGSAAGSFDSKRGMAKPSEFDAVEIHTLWCFNPSFP
jgi:hypothetical protein